MKHACLHVAVFGLMACVAAVEFEQRPRTYQVQETNYDYDGEPAVTADEAVTTVGDDQSSLRTTHHHGKHKLKKKLKKQLLHCLLQQHHGRRRRRRETTGRFFIPLVSQNTNVNVGGPGTGGQYDQYGSGGCMQMLNGHGPLGSFTSAFGSPAVAEEGGGNRAGTYAADWNRYARQFRRNVVRPLYRLF